MSNAKVSTTNNTNTSTPRSPKTKKGKFVKLDLTTLEKTATPVAPTEPTEPAAPAAEPTELTEPVATESEPVVSEPKPVVNVWKLRKEAAEARQKALEAEAALHKAEEAASSDEDEMPDEVTEAPKQEDEGEFVLVKHKNNKLHPKPKGKPHYKPKPQHQAEGAATKPKAPAASTGKPKAPTASTGKPQHHAEGAAPTAATGKPKFFKKREFSSEEKAAHGRKMAAQEKAESIVLADCVRAIPKGDLENINSGVQYILNYSKTVVLDVSNDDVIVKLDGETYQFSRLRFLENRFFQNKVRDSFSSLIPSVWIRFFPGRYEGTYCMGLQRRRD